MDNELMHAANTRDAPLNLVVNQDTFSGIGMSSPEPQMGDVVFMKTTGALGGASPASSARVR